MQEHLSQERVEELIRAAQEGERQAEEELFTANLGLVYMALERFKNTPYDFEDLFQIGAIGLLKAIARFDFSYNVRFSTYAVPMIIGEIKRYLRDDGALKVQRSLKEIYFKAKRIQDQLRAETGQDPTIGEIAELLGCETEDIVMALEACQTPAYIYDVLPGEDREQPLQVIDKLKDPVPRDYFLDKLALQEAIMKLESREQQIILRRFFNDETQSVIATDLGISQVQVSRLEKKALKKLKALLA